MKISPSASPSVPAVKDGELRDICCERCLARLVSWAESEEFSPPTPCLAQVGPRVSERSTKHSISHNIENARLGLISCACIQQSASFASRRIYQYTTTLQSPPPKSKTPSSPARAQDDQELLRSGCLGVYVVTPGVSRSSWAMYWTRLSQDSGDNLRPPGPAERSSRTTSTDAAKREVETQVALGSPAEPTRLSCIFVSGCGGAGRMGTYSRRSLALSSNLAFLVNPFWNEVVWGRQALVRTGKSPLGIGGNIPPGTRLFGHHRSRSRQRRHGPAPAAGCPRAGCCGALEST